MKRMVFAAVAALVCGAAFAADYSAFVAKAKAQVTKDFKDPEGAKFRGLAVYTQADGKSLGLCGEVNAKNSYGAFTGYVPFYADSKRATLREDGDDTLFSSLMPSYCDKKLAPVK